jgi:hypothetical protein
MTYAVASALQSAVYQALQADTALAVLVGNNVFDELPKGDLPSLFVSLGPETAVDASDADGEGAWHRFTVSVVTESAGFQSAKDAAGAISDALHGADMALSRGRLVGLWFQKAVARRLSGKRRQIDMVFRARVEDAVAG